MASIFDQQEQTRDRTRQKWMNLASDVPKALKNIAQETLVDPTSLVAAPLRGLRALTASQSAGYSPDAEAVWLQKAIPKKRFGRNTVSPDGNTIDFPVQGVRAEWHGLRNLPAVEKLLRTVPDQTVASVLGRSGNHELLTNMPPDVLAGRVRRANRHNIGGADGVYDTNENAQYLADPKQFAHETGHAVTNFGPNRELWAHPAGLSPVGSPRGWQTYRMQNDEMLQRIASQKTYAPDISWQDALKNEGFDPETFTRMQAQGRIGKFLDDRHINYQLNKGAKRIDPKVPLILGAGAAAGAGLRSLRDD